MGGEVNSPEIGYNQEQEGYIYHELPAIPGPSAALSPGMLLISIRLKGHLNADFHPSAILHPTYSCYRNSLLVGSISSFEKEASSVFSMIDFI